MRSFLAVDGYDRADRPDGGGIMCGVPGCRTTEYITESLARTSRIGIALQTRCFGVALDETQVSKERGSPKAQAG